MCILRKYSTTMLRFGGEYPKQMLILMRQRCNFDELALEPSSNCAPLPYNNFYQVKQGCPNFINNICTFLEYSPFPCIVGFHFVDFSRANCNFVIQWFSFISWVMFLIPRPFTRKRRISTYRWEPSLQQVVNLVSLYYKNVHRISNLKNYYYATWSIEILFLGLSLI